MERAVPGSRLQGHGETSYFDEAGVTKEIPNL